MEQRFRRQIAYKLVVKEILDSPYTKTEGWGQSYLEVADAQVSRVNAIGIIVEQAESRILIEDSTGSIAVETSSACPEVGTPVLIIGKVREGNQRILFAEIIKRLSSPDWIKLRNLEYSKRRSVLAAKLPGIPMASKNLTQEVYSMIKSHDSGDGVDIQAITSQYPQAEKIVQNLIAEGEVFEIRPGRLKVLE